MTISELIEERGLKGACKECHGKGCHWCFWTGEDDGESHTKENCGECFAEKNHLVDPHTWLRRTY